MWVGRRQTSEPVQTLNVANPLGLATAIKFGLLYALVNFLVKAATHFHLATGLIAISAVAGLTDVDAITISTSEAVRDTGLPLGRAAVAVVTACISNTIVKAAMSAWLGAPELRRLTLSVLGATTAAGAVALLLAS